MRRDTPFISIPPWVPVACLTLVGGDHHTHKLTLCLPCEFPHVRPPSFSPLFVIVSPKAAPHFSRLPSFLRWKTEYSLTSLGSHSLPCTRFITQPPTQTPLPVVDECHKTLRGLLYHLSHPIIIPLLPQGYHFCRETLSSWLCFLPSRPWLSFPCFPSCGEALTGFRDAISQCHHAQFLVIPPVLVPLLATLKKLAVVYRCGLPPAGLGSHGQLWGGCC